MKNRIVTCPKCKKDIAHLDFDVHTTETGTLSVDEKGEEEFNYENSGFWQGADFRFFCPECGEEISDDATTAVRFFKREE